MLVYVAVFVLPEDFGSVSFDRRQSEGGAASMASHLRIEFILAVSVVALVVLLG